MYFQQQPNLTLDRKAGGSCSYRQECLLFSVFFNACLRRPNHEAENIAVFTHVFMQVGNFRTDAS